MIRPVWVEVDLEKISNNIKNIINKVGSSSQVMAVVKANGYGHGSVEVAKIALEAGAQRLGVALVEEAVCLREAGIKAPIYLLTAPTPKSGKKIEMLDLIPTIYRTDHLIELKDAQFKVHIKVDTGMNRTGVKPEELDEFYKTVKSMSNIEVEGIYTHFATADNPDSDLYGKQLSIFKEIATKYKNEVPMLHCANSASTLFKPESHFDMVRIGIAMYGLRPSCVKESTVSLEAALSLKANISHIKKVPAGQTVGYGAKYTTLKDEVIATIPIGYADGYFRGLTNKSSIIVNGKKMSQTGTICMDQLMFKADENIKIGDTATLIGNQGNASFTADDIAKIMNTINYEVVCAISNRIPRIYI